MNLYIVYMSYSYTGLCLLAMCCRNSAGFLHLSPHTGQLWGLVAHFLTWSFHGCCPTKILVQYKHFIPWFEVVTNAESEKPKDKSVTTLWIIYDHTCRITTIAMTNSTSSEINILTIHENKQQACLFVTMTVSLHIKALQGWQPVRGPNYLGDRGCMH